jgi:hypothetical protein
MQPWTADPHVTVEREENHAVIALAAPALAARFAAAMPLHPGGDLSVDGSLLDRSEQLLTLGDRQAEVLRALRHLLERGDVRDRAVGTVIIGNLQQNFHTHPRRLRDGRGLPADELSTSVGVESWEPARQPAWHPGTRLFWPIESSGCHQFAVRRL